MRIDQQLKDVLLAQLATLRRNTTSSTNRAAIDAMISQINGAALDSPDELVFTGSVKIDVTTGTIVALDLNGVTP